MASRVLLIAALAVACIAPAPDRSATAEKVLPLRHGITDGIVDAHVGSVDKLLVESSFRYIGGQRFVLQNTADAEQHIFADVDSSGAVRRLYWIQLEEMLPGKPGTYDYSRDSTMTVDGLSLRVNVGRHTTSPPDNSDRAAVYRLLERAGLTPPLPATRVRMIYLPDEKKRTEVMVIYVERTGDAAGTPSMAGPDVIARATSGVQFLTK